MNIFITGASGFVGPVLARQLLKKESDSKIWGSYYLYNEIAQLDKGLMKSYNLDLQNLNAVKAMLNEINPDRIYHLAAQSSVRISWANPQLTFNINVVGTINLLEAIKQYNSQIPVLIIGSSEEYGVLEGPAKEVEVCEPINPYGISKLAQEYIAKLYSNVYNMHIKMTRSFNHIGPMQIENFVIPDWCKQIAEIEILGKEPILKVGNIDVIRDFCHVEDICDAYIDILENGKKGESYNVGSGKAISLRSIIEKLVSFSNKDIQIDVDPNKVRPVDTPEITCDRSKLDSISKNKFRSIDDTLLSMLNTWRKNITLKNK